MSWAIDKAVARGLLTPVEAARIGKGRSGRRRMRPPLPKEARSKAALARHPVADGPYSPIDGMMPQEMLWRAILSRWPRHGSDSDYLPEWEYPAPIPGKPGPPYRIDIAFPALALAIEVDGWQYHGKHKADFQRDRRRERLLVIHGGWRFLRFFVKEIRDQRDAVLHEIEQAIATLAAQRQDHSRNRRLTRSPFL